MTPTHASGLLAELQRWHLGQTGRVGRCCPWRVQVAPFGIHTTIVNPGFFRTELLTPESTNFAETPIDDYAAARAAQIEWWTSQNGKQLGDPAKLAQALLTIAPAEAVLEMTDRVGVDAALECVGTAQAFTTAMAVTRPGGMVGYVGVPHSIEVPITT